MLDKQAMVWVKGRGAQTGATFCPNEKLSNPLPYSERIQDNLSSDIGKTLPTLSKWEPISLPPNPNLPNIATIITYPNQCISKTICKGVYWNFVTKRRRVQKCCEKTIQKDYPNFEKAENIWPNIFKLRFNTTRKTKLQSFQYWIIHRTITCRKTLCDINLNNSPKCLFCYEIYNIRHFPLFFPKVHNFWNSFSQWWNRMGDLNFSRLWLWKYVLSLAFTSGGDHWSPKCLYFNC